MLAEIRDEGNAAVSGPVRAVLTQAAAGCAAGQVLKIKRTLRCPSPLPSVAVPVQFQ